MTQDQFEKGYILTDKIRKLQHMKEKLKRDFPEWEYDKEAKETGDEIIQLIDNKIGSLENDFSELSTLKSKKMPVKSRSKTFKPGDDYDEILDFIHDEINNVLSIEHSETHPQYSKYQVNKRLIITITYDRDDKTE